MDDRQCAKVSTPEPVSKKHPRGLLTFCTPHRVRKRTPLRQQRTLDENLLAPRVLSQSMEQSNSKVQEKWSDLELQALTEFVLFHFEGEFWPAHKHEVFWNSASEYVHTRSGNNVVRTGK